MLKKLLKHEILASYRVHLSLYLGVVFLAVISTFSFRFEREVFGALVFGLLMISIGALAVFTMYNIVISMYTRVYGKPGYLLFATPAKTWEILVAKVLVNLGWLFLTTVVSVFSFSLFFVLVVPPGAFDEINQILSQFILVDASFWIAFGVQTFVSLLYQIGFFAFLFAMLNLMYKGEKKVLMGLLLYFGLNYILSGILSLFTGSMYGFNIDYVGGVMQFESGQLWGVTAVYFVTAALLYGVTYYLMEKKLELQ